MFVRHLTLAQFRSWETAELPLEPGVNVLIGRNGVGKTNLVEAVGYLAGLASHRVSSDAPLIRRGADQAVVRAAVVSDGRELLLEVEINAGRANRGRINRSPLPRTRDLLGVLRTVLFAPEDLALVRGDPGERRRFLDDLLVMRSPRLAGVRADYDKLIKQRTALLKSAGPARRAGDLSTLDVWDEHLASAGAILLAARLDLVDTLREPVVRAYAELAPASEPVDLRYRSSLGDAFPPEVASGRAVEHEPELTAALLAEMTRRRGQELDRGVCLVGPHRDELELLLGDGPARGYASHGESWSLALALKIGGFRVLAADGVDPVLILDDVFAELDVTRRSRLADLVVEADQVLITAAVPGDVPARLTGRRLSVTEAGVVVGTGPDGEPDPSPDASSSVSLDVGSAAGDPVDTRSQGAADAPGPADPMEDQVLDVVDRPRPSVDGDALHRL